MADAITNVMSRRVALDAARTALKSGSRSALKKALASLPDSGEKAAGLRAKIEAVLGQQVEINLRKAEVDSDIKIICVSDGIAYQFAVEEYGSLAFFRVARSGSVVSVTINSAHPFGAHVASGDKLNDSTFLQLLAAWAHFELDQASPKTRDAVRVAREDWSRILIRLAGRPMELMGGDADSSLGM